MKKLFHYFSAALGLLFFFDVSQVFAFDLKAHFYDRLNARWIVPSQLWYEEEGVFFYWDYNHWRNKRGENNKQVLIEDRKKVSLQKNVSWNELRVSGFLASHQVTVDSNLSESSWELEERSLTQQSQVYAFAIGADHFWLGINDSYDRKLFSLGVDSLEGMQLHYLFGEAYQAIEVSGFVENNQFLLSQDVSLPVKGISVILDRDWGVINLTSLNDAHDQYQLNHLSLALSDFSLQYDYEAFISGINKLWINQHQVNGEYWRYKLSQESIRSDFLLSPETSIALVATRLNTSAKSEFWASRLAGLWGGILGTGNANGSIFLQTNQVAVSTNFRTNQWLFSPEIAFGETKIEGGLRYSVNYWPFGVADASETAFPYDSLQHLILDLPLRWQTGQFAVEYRVQQLIPLGIKYREGYDDHSGGGAGKSSSMPSFSQLPDMNMQTLTLSLAF